MDRATIRILERLQQNARHTTGELAEHAGLSPSPCWRRVRDMERKGVISRYVALLDPKRIGLAVNIFIHVSLEKQTDEALARFQATVAELPEVMECYLMSGEADYLLRVVCPNLDRYREFLLTHLTTIPGIANIRSSFALDQVKYTTALPLSYVDRDR